MTSRLTKQQLVLTIQEYADCLSPSLIGKLKEEQGFTIRDAKKVSENVIQRLNLKFKVCNPQPVEVFQQTIAIIVLRETNKFKRLMDKNFGLSEDSFNEMVENLRAGNEQFYEKVFIDHFDSCMAFLKRKYNISHQDAYDASMETLVTFCRKLKQGKIQYGNLRFLFTQMSTRYYLDWSKREKKVEEFTDYDVAEELPRFDKESYELLGKAFSQLGEGCRELLNSFYFEENTLNEIASKTTKKAAAIRKQKQRCVEKLRVFFAGLS